MTQKRAARFREPLFRWNESSELTSDLDDVFRRRTLGTLNDVELDALAFGEGAETATLDRRVMDEAILLATLRRDEAEALRVIEPLHGAGRASHTQYPKCVVVVSSEYRNEPYKPTHSYSAPQSSRGMKISQ